MIRATSAGCNAGCSTSLKLFSRLIIFTQWDMTVEASLEYQLTPFPLSLFSNKDQKTNKTNKADFSKISLKDLTNLLDLTDQPCSSLVVDGGWLLYMVTWEQGQTWQEIADSYLSYRQCLGSHSQKITVVFNGYSSFFVVVFILHSSRHFAHMMFYFQVRAEDADMLVMLVHHSSSTIHPIFLTTLKGSYDVREVREALSERQRCCLLFCHVFTGCDMVSALWGHGK